MIIKTQQQPCPVSCTSTSVAMLASLPAAEVIERFHADYRSGAIGFGGMLKSLNVPYQAFMSDDDSACLDEPGAYLLTVPSLNLDAQNHNVVLEMHDDGDWYMHDPCRGREGKRYYVNTAPQNDLEITLSSGYSIDAFVSMQDLLEIYGAS